MARSRSVSIDFTSSYKPEYGSDLKFVRKLEDGVAIFQSSFIGTGAGSFEYTVRSTLMKRIAPARKPSNAGLNSPAVTGSPMMSMSTVSDDDIDWKWAANFGQNGKIYVSPPSEDLPWTKGPQMAEGKLFHLVISVIYDLLDQTSDHIQ